MWRLALSVACVAAVGCGGNVSKADQHAGAAGSAPASNGGSANGGSAQGGATSEPLGDPHNPNYPPIPVEGGGFFWRLGLGNWFIHTSGGISKDATLDEDAGTATWKAEGAALESVDLWAQLNHPSGMAVDLSAYSGISFDAQLTGAPAATLVVAFGANGDYAAAATASGAQRFTLTEDWQTYQLRFSDIGYAANATTSIDFIVPSSNAPFVLRIRNLALLCSGSCP